MWQSNRPGTRTCGSLTPPVAGTCGSLTRPGARTCGSLTDQEPGHVSGKPDQHPLVDDTKCYLVYILYLRLWVSKLPLR